MDDPLAKIDQLISGFFDSFDNREGRLPSFGFFSRHFVEGSAIAKRTDEGLDSWSLPSFWEPRMELLSSGRLTDFHEWEVESDTSIVDGLALRRCSYQKEGLLDGLPYTGNGTKCFQLALTPAGWRIIYLLWEDHA